MHRDGNQAADFLVKLGASSWAKDCVWEKSPVGLALIHLADSSEVFHMG